MSVMLPYHLGGKFIIVGSDLVYEGGEVFVIKEVDPESINLFDLEVAIKSRVGYSH
ncbi:hypothetical protein LINPERPRIM_LOCUS21901, partial [Linum perenne]